MLEIFNQISIYSGKNNYSKNFWEVEPFLKNQKANYIKWQKAWKNRIEYYTPRDKPEYDFVPVDGLIENWDPKARKGESQIKTIKISPMFGADVVKLYRTANESHSATIKSADPAEKFRSLVGLDIKFMVGSDQAWDFSDDEPAALSPADRAAAGPAKAVLPPAAPSDDAPAPPAQPVDPSDMTTWNVLDIASIPLPAQSYDANNFRAGRTAHAGLLLCYMSPEAEAAFP